MKRARYLIVILFLGGCNLGYQNNSPKPESELGLYMKQMQEDMSGQRNLLVSKQPHGARFSYGEKIREKDKGVWENKNPGFDLMTRKMQMALNAYDACHSDSAVVLFDNVIITCLACHKKMGVSENQSLRQLIIPDSLVR